MHMRYNMPSRQFRPSIRVVVAILLGLGAENDAFSCLELPEKGIEGALRHPRCLNHDLLQFLLGPAFYNYHFDQVLNCINGLLGNAALQVVVWVNFAWNSDF